MGITVGLLGYGQVGKNIPHFIQQYNNTILNYEKMDEIRLSMIGVRNLFLNSDGSARTMSHSLGATFTQDLESIIDNRQIDVIVEAIKNTELSKKCIADALKAGKIVVSCSKDVWVKHREELSAISKETGSPLYLNSLVASTEPEPVFDYDLNENTIMDTDMYKATRFYGADGYVTADAVVKDLILINQNQKKNTLTK